MHYKIAALLLLPLSLSFAQPAVNLPRQSPAASVSQSFAYTTATVQYARPAVRGRVIWGQVVPYGQVWRAGANEATSIEFSTDVRVAGLPLAKGKYAFFVLPEKTGWTFIFNRVPGWGAYAYDAANDVLRVPVKPAKAPHAERLEYAFSGLTDSSAVLSLHWEALKASVTVSAEFRETAFASIRDGLPKAKADDPYSWLNAARFTYAYGEGDSARAKAFEYLDRSIAVRPLYLNLWTKAEWLAEAKRYPEAVEAGRKAWIEAAKDPALEPQLPALDKTLKAWEKKAKK